MRALPDQVRAFVALRMNPATEAAVMRFVEELHERDDGVAWVRNANLHLTLRFLGGAAPAAMLAALDRALRQIGAATPALLIRVCGAGAFPNLDRPRVLWIGLRGELLTELAERVEAAARECGFAPELRPFTAHLTIGRVRHLRGWARLRERLAQRANQESGESLVESMLLYQSVPGPGGAAYEVIARYPFHSHA
jgi:RNA 2',3'-cyclic 3'-phosphodiesterase